ncbi:MAG: CoA ester lyase [Caulobacterales bacterium]
MSANPRPRRSVLYMPGGNARALEKAKTLAADTVIFDLEDSVAPDAKPAARETAAAAVAQGGYGMREVIVRINSLSTSWGADDMKAAVKCKPAGILVPKVSAPGELDKLNSMLDDLGAPPEMGLWAMIETPLAILNIREIAAASDDTRLSGFVMGCNDLAKEMGASAGLRREAFLTALSMSVMAARAHGLVAIDGVYNDINDLEGFEAECLQGLNLGFDGKTLIHPSQIDICNRVYAPADDEVAAAQAVIDAFADPANAGQGVIKVNGKMTELLHLEQARRTIAIANAIAALRAA